MPQPADLIKVTWQFSLASVEVAQFDMWCAANVPPPDDPSWDALLQNVAGSARDGWKASASRSHYSVAVELKGCVAGRYSATGHVLNEQRAITASGDWVGSDDSSMPWSTAICVNLYTYTPGTFIALNRSRRGRIFLPPPGVDVLADDGTGEMSTGIPPALLTEVRNVVLAVQAAHVTVGVLSTTHNFFNHLTDITTDVKLDTHRSRAKREPAALSTQAI